MSKLFKIQYRYVPGHGESWWSFRNIMKAQQDRNKPGNWWLSWLGLCYYPEGLLGNIFCSQINSGFIYKKKYEILKDYFRISLS